MAGAIYGIDHVKLMAAMESGATAGQYPDFDTLASGFRINAIVKDSFSFSDTAPSTNDIEVEDMDAFYAQLQSDNGSETFTLQTYDMNKDAYEYLLGYTTSGAWNEETPGFKLGNQALEIKSKALDSFPARIFQWARLSCKVTKTGTLGKSGFPNFNLEFTKLANLDTTGAEISGARWKTV